MVFSGLVGSLGIFAALATLFAILVGLVLASGATGLQLCDSPLPAVMHTIVAAITACCHVIH